MGNVVENMRHVAQMSDREDWVQQPALTLMLSAHSRQHAWSEDNMKVTVDNTVMSKRRQFEHYTYFDGSNRFGNIS